MNAQYIIPGRSVQIAHAQKYSSSLRYMFPDPINEAGWQIYAGEVVFNKYLEELAIVAQVFDSELAFAPALFR